MVTRTPDEAKRNPGLAAPDYGAARRHPGYDCDTMDFTLAKC